MTAAPFVLLVDDDQDTRELYEYYFVSSGFRVMTAREGVEAVHLSQVHAPDIVVTDFKLPGLDGAGVIRQLRADPRTAEIPVLMLTGSMDYQTEAEWRALGVDRFFLKPMLPDELCRHVERALGLGLA